MRIWPARLRYAANVCALLVLAACLPATYANAGEQFQVLSPQWTNDKTAFSTTEIAQGETGVLKLNWKDWATKGLWVSGGVQEGLGPWPAEDFADKIWVRVNGPGFGTIHASLTHPEQYTSDGQQAAKQETAPPSDVPPFPRATATRSPYLPQGPSAIWVHSDEHIHFVICHSGFLQTGLEYSQYEDTKVSPSLWNFQGHINVLSGKRTVIAGKNHWANERRFSVDFDYSPPELTLSLAGKEYDLREGRVFVFKPSGYVKQLAIAPIPVIKNRKGIERVEDFVDNADSLIFEDNFDAGLSKAWQLIELNEEDYRIRDGGLEMRVQPGRPTRNPPRLQVNLPFDSSEDAVVASVEVSILDRFTEPVEFAGMCLTDEDGPDFGVEKKLIDGYLVFSPGDPEFIGEPGEEGDPSKYSIKYSPAVKEAGPLRIIVRSDYAYFQVGPSKKGNYANFFHSAINDDATERGFCLLTGGGPDDAEHWVRFENFRVIRN